jgi:hypothetical protein
MARTRNEAQTKTVQIATTTQVWNILRALARTGRFGKNAAEVAEELMRAKVREVELEGWVSRGRRR